ncbi:MAG: methionine--tRNA ligase [Candidatus Omnitrophica bacterium]|nr:methionine--tRNA ligase [Candidatus Omnitrophota bacterium]
MKKKFYITTAIDYPSAPPHIGHVYEKVCADVIARWHRKKGCDVFFSTGTDEHGQKIQRCALKSNEKAEEFVERMSKKFIDLWEKLNISYDSFIRTTQMRHIEIVQTILKKIYEKGDIYKGLYEGLYCVDCEAFYAEKDTKSGLCPIHNKKVEKIKEESYFFKMGKYQERILKYIENNKDFIQPKFRKKEIINRIKEGIRDLSVSRSSFNWGIPLPMDKKHVIFVWFDALLNYISVLDYPKKRFRKYWPADIHLIGKDILWFHTVVWLAILLAADIELPRKVFVHGFINIKGEKISKSAGIAIDPIGLVNRYGADALRYFLLREIPFGEDGDFSEDALIRRINSDLANDLGNLLHRSLTMIEKYFQGTIPGAKHTDAFDKPLISQAKELPEKYFQAMERIKFGQALDSIWALINAANKYIEEVKPWQLAKQKNLSRLACVVYNLAEVLRIVAIVVYPFIPQTSLKMLEALGLKIDLDDFKFKDLLKWGGVLAGTKVNKGKPLFPRIV